MLNYGGLLKQKHKILNLDDVEDGNLINTSDEEEKAHSITAIWNFEKQNYYLKNLKSLKASVFLCFFAPAGTIAFNQHGCPVFTQKIILCVNGQCLKNSTLVLLEFLFVKLRYIYLAHICVLRAYIRF